jgi:preprotein translocase subunit SecF
MRLREEQMRIQETEARARAEHQAQIEAARLQHEMEIRRVEAHKKRPVWLVITVSVAVVAAIIAIVLTVQSSNEKDKAERARIEAQEAERKANEDKKKAEEAQRLAELEVEGFRVKLSELSKQMDDADRDLLAANNQADRDKVAARQAAIREQQRQVQAEIDRRRQKVKTKCPPSQPLC